MRRQFQNTCHILIDEGLQFLYLRPEFPDKLHVRVFIDGRLVDDIFRTIGISESAESIVVITFRRTDGRNHDSLGIAAEGILQQPREHAVPIRDERISLRGGRITARGTYFRERGYHSA